MTYIARLRGEVAVRAPDSLVVDVNGVGYRAHVPAGALAATAVGDSVVLHTHLQVREDGIALYGFLDPDELALFEQLITVSGVGPRSALALLSLLSAADLRVAIASGATDVLKRVPGIGAKTAGRIVLELQSRLGEAPVAVGGPSPGADDALAALRSLGYSQQEALDALAAAGSAPDASTEERLRNALRYFALSAR